MKRVVRALIFSASLVVGCAPGSSATMADRSSEARQSSRTLAILTRAEPPSIGSGLHGSGISVDSAIRPFIGHLVLNNGHDQFVPYLAEAVPELNTERWKVFPDGRMETSYQLRPNLTWHDGTPLSAQDFAFAYKVRSNPEIGATPYIGGRIEDVLAPNDQTIIVQWRGIWAPAATTQDLQSLPRHILEQPLAHSSADAFLAHPYWRHEYVGLGPFKLEQWDPGASIQGVAFDKHVLGRPKVDRISIRWSADENTALANILSESVHLVSDRSIRFEQAAVLQNEWKSTDKGKTILTPTQARNMFFQSRPEYANPPVVLDLRARRALIHSIDRDALNEGLFGGAGFMWITNTPQTVPFYAELDRAITKYAYDPRRTEQLMNEVGYTKGADGLFVSGGGEKLSLQLMNQAGVQPERETAIMQATWRSAGIETFAYIVPVSQSTDAQARATFPALQNGQGGLSLTSNDIGTPQNRWRGGNRGGWSNADFDQAVAAFDASLSGSDLARYTIQMERIISEHLPIMHLFKNFSATAHLSILRGPDSTVVNDTLLVWNIHEWQIG